MAKQTFTTGQVLTAAQMTSLQQTAMGGGSTTAKTTSYVLVAADAGTVVQMNAAGATTITVNNALFAAGDVVQIQNIGAGTCTITAGTATVTTAGSLALSQWENGDLYFTSSSASIFFDVMQSGSGMTNPMTTTGDTIYSSSGSTPARLGIGSTGQVLTVASGLPSWATPTGGSGLTLISTTTFSAVTSQNITGIFSSTYTNYIAVITELLGSADPITPRFQYLYSTNTVQSGGYAGGMCGFNYSGTANSDNIANTYSQTQYSLPSLATTTQSAATMTFFGPNLGTNKATVNIDWASQGTGWRYVGAGSQNTSQAYTGLRFTTASGTMSGTISVYGMAK